MRKGNSKKGIVAAVAAVLVVFLAAGAVLAALILPVRKTFRNAMEQSENAPYAEADAVLSNAIAALEGKPFADDSVRALSERRDALKTAEIERAIASDELSYAADLVKDVDPERSKELDIELAYRTADAMEQAGNDEGALAAFLALGNVRDAQERAAVIRERMEYRSAQAVFTGGNYDEAIAALRALHTERGDEAAAALEQQKAAMREELRKTAQGRIAAGLWHTAAIGKTPWIAGDARYAQAPEDAGRVLSGLAGLLFLKNGTVFCTGETYGAEAEIASYTDVVDAATGLNHALFLHADGKVTGLGSKAFGRLETADWTDVVSVAAGAWHSVAAKADGTVLARGGNQHGQCDVDAWSDVACVSAGLWHTAALKKDGTAVACGDNTYGQCEVSEWSDLVAIVCGACHTVGLKADGTVVACGDNTAGQCEVSAWTDVAAIAAGAYHTVAVRLDGKTVSAGLLPHPLPEEPLFDSVWECEPIDAASMETAQATPYIEGEGEDLGPWLYLDPHGAAMICLDDSEERMPFRADLLATADALPGGRVTTPEASGHVIHMLPELPYEQAQKHHAVVAFTGDYIGFTSNRKGVMLRNGVVYYDRAETTTLAVLPDGTLTVYQKGKINAEQLVALGVKDSFSFGPVLVENGECVVDKQLKEITMRVAFGYSDPYHYITAVSERDRDKQMSHRMIAEVCIRYGCRLAYNLDGGHSTSLSFLGKELSLLSFSAPRPHSNYRGLSDIIVFLADQNGSDSGELR